MKVILQHCFEDRQEILAMVEGDSLEKLVEKVMELFRDVHFQIIMNYLIIKVVVFTT